MSPGEVLHEPGIPVVSVLLAALASDDVSAESRDQILDLLQVLVGDNGQSFAAAAQGRDLVQECRRAAAPGIWLLYREVMSSNKIGTASAAYEILTILEGGTDRIKALRQTASDQLAFWVDHGDNNI